MINKLIAFRIPPDIEQIMDKAMKEQKLNKTDFVLKAIVNQSGYDYIPAKIIKRLK